ncbi:Ig domain-containing protein [Kribbella speibonae]|uniref:Ig domain-containing protein n=1 Tax=Kribbella speibonae TaxID=1572660 RepID=UPI00192D76CA|nr:Ig domain-containing protein [Kribbella speibonae]
MRKRRITGSLVAVALALSSFWTEPANAAPPLRIEAGFLSIGLSSNGRVTALTDIRSGKDYLAPGKSAPLISLMVDGRLEEPTGVTPRRPGTLQFKLPSATVDVTVERRPTYTTLVISDLRARPGADVRTAFWGPLPTVVNPRTHADQEVGEAVGVVRDPDFAIGLRPLNDKTVGAWPIEDEQYGFAADVIENPYDLQVDTMYEWSAAAVTPWGSLLRAYTDDYSKRRTRQEVNGFGGPATFELGPLHGPDASIIGSSIALFGSGPDLAPAVLSQIEVGENQPHPTLNGQWQKVSQASSASEFWLSTNSQNATAYADLARQAGLDWIYDASGGRGPWKSTGHYGLNDGYQNSDDALATAVAGVNQRGVQFGAHTLSDFIEPNDAYLKAPADKRLAVRPGPDLTRAVAADGTELYVDGVDRLTPGPADLLRVGDEFIRYTTQEKVGDDEWKLTGITRGYWSSVAAAHSPGDEAQVVVKNSYGGAIGGLDIIDEIAGRLGSLYGKAGLKGISFDGLESASQSGWGSYGVARMVNGFYRDLGPAAADGFVSEASRISSNTWSVQTRMSWGEPNITSLDQVIRNNRFYRANFLPGMMGQTNLTPARKDAIVGALAVAASWNAGSQYYASLSLGDTAAGKELLATVRAWESARNAGAFTAEQRAALGDTTKRWQLTMSTPDREWSLQELDLTGAPVGAPQTVTTAQPQLIGDPPPAGTIGKLYEYKLTSNTPQTRKFTVTKGSLPAGLRLDADTGAITGIPSRQGVRSFTVTTSNGAQPTASASYTITTS